MSTNVMSTSGSAEESGIPVCLDCGRPYPHGLDFVLTWKQWTTINPEGSGVLCPSCMVNRAAKIPGVISMYGCIIVNEDLDPTGTLESMVASLRLENSDYCRINREQAYLIEHLQSAASTGDKPEEQSYV